MSTTELLKREIKLPIGFIFSTILAILSLGAGYGGVKAAFDSQAKEISAAKAEIVSGKTQIKSLETALWDLKYELGRVRQSMDDLRESINKSR